MIPEWCQTKLWEKKHIKANHNDDVDGDDDVTQDLRFSWL